MEENIRYEQLLRDLYNTDVQLAGVCAAKFERATQDKLDTIVDGKAAFVHEQAKKYGQSIELADKVLETYGDSLESIRNEYAKGSAAILSQNASFNKTEIHNFEDAYKAKMAIGHAKQNGDDYTKEQEELEGCKMIATAAAVGSNSAYESVDDIILECNDYLEEIADNKQLTAVEKQNKLISFFSNLLSKVDGKRKFETNVLTPLEEQSNQIEEKVQVANEKVKNSLNEKIKNTFNNMKAKIQEFGGKIAEKLKDIDVKKVVQTLLLTVTGTAMVLGMYSPVNFGLDVTSAIGSWMNEKEKNNIREETGAVLA